MEAIRYFAYNLHMDAHSLDSLNILVISSTPAFLKNYRLAFNVLEDERFRFEKRGLINIMPQAGDAVEGILYEIDEFDLTKLDAEAGVNRLKYYRKKVEVFSKCGHVPMEALTYAAWPDVTAQGLLPSGHYLKKLIAAACRHGISPDFQRRLRSHSTTA